MAWRVRRVCFNQFPFETKVVNQTKPNQTNKLTWNNDEEDEILKLNPLQLLIHILLSLFRNSILYSSSAPD